MYARIAAPGFAGPISFMRAPWRSMESSDSGGIAVVGLPGVDEPYSGTPMLYGSEAIRTASLELAAELDADPHREYVDIESGARRRFRDPLPIADCGDVVIGTDDAATVSDCVADIAAGILARDTLCVFLGGGRAISGPLVTACASALRGARRLALVRLTPSLGLGEASRPLDGGAVVSSTIAAGTVQEEDVAWIGLHGYIPLPEWERARNGGGVVLTAEQLATPTTLVRDALEGIRARCDAVYLSVDLGAVDTGYASGTTDLRVGGLQPSTAIELVGALADLPLVAVDIVEVFPERDASGRTARLAFELILQALGRRLTEPEKGR
jgi:arginase family enzyme